MKVSLQWLKDYVSPGVSAEKLMEKLTMAGLEVEKHHSVDGDTVFEMEITPNRADCLSMIGVAREAATLYNKPLKKPKIRKYGYANKKCNVVIKDKKGCSQYNGTLIENVVVGDSPTWLKKKIEAIGLRPVNNIVDITNFCLMELGQPLHAFDFDKLEDGKIIVRRAKKGESIVTIDGQEIKLDKETLVIADGKRPVAIAGVMGGKDTEVTKKTKNILLESAHFDPVLIRRTSRALALSSDSSYRFERGIHNGLVAKGADRAISLILETAEGTLTKRSNVVAQKIKSDMRKISIKGDDINARLGASIPQNKIKQILKGLGIQIDVKKDVYQLTMPPFRPDIKESEDIVEEVARIIGYDELPSSLPLIKTINIEENATKNRREKIRDRIIAAGFSEIITFAMINGNLLEKSGLGGVKELKIKNPLSLDQEIMRPSLLPNMLNVILTNVNRGQKNLTLFEIGKIYNDKGEKEVLNFAMTGTPNFNWRTKTSSAGLFDVKGIAEEVLKSAGVNLEKCSSEKTEESHFDQSEQLSISLGSKHLSCLGKIRTNVLTNWHIKNIDVYYGEVDLETLYANIDEKQKYQSLGDYPSVVRDISLAIDEKTTYEQVVTCIKEFSDNILSDVVFVEEYVGEKIQSGQRGLIFSLTYQSKDRTLREEEVNQAHEKICEGLVSTLKATHR